MIVKQSFSTFFYPFPPLLSPSLLSSLGVRGSEDDDAKDTDLSFFFLKTCFMTSTRPADLDTVDRFYLRPCQDYVFFCWLLFYVLLAWNIEKTRRLK